MHFNDLCPFCWQFYLTASYVSQLYKVLQALHGHRVEISWDVITLRSYIFETIYPIAVKFVEVMQ